MTYSIVETVENGKRICTVTPTRWVQGELLYIGQTMTVIGWKEL